MLPGKTYTPEEVLRILWHRKWLLIVPFVVAAVSSAVMAWRLPEKFRSETLIQVIPQRIPESYVRSTVTTQIQARLAGIEQIVKSRSRLETIILEFDLYPEQRKVLGMDDVVALMREDIDVAVERDAFRVTYVAGDPIVAQRVAERLGALFIDENLRDREALAQETSHFLEGQLAEAKQRLVTHEKKLEAYRLRHAGELPSQAQGNLQGMQNAQMQLQGLTETMNRDRERRLLIERQIADLEAAETPSAPLPVINAPGPPAPPSTAEQLEKEMTDRRNLLVRFKPDHPDVLASNRRIRDLEAKLQAEMASRPAAAGEPARPLSASETVRLNRIRSLQATLHDVDRALATSSAEERRLRGVVADYQSKLAAAPTRESELTELMRDYATLQGIYTSLLAKREDSKISANVERQQIGEQFKIVEKARAPDGPFSPNRPRLAMMGSAVGLALGIGLIGFLEYRDSTFKNEDEVLRVLQIPVLALVPMMASEMEERARHRRKLLVAVAFVVMIVSSAAAVAVWKLQGS